jgi:tetratricopeptide (TPR) repeat protein
VAHHYQRAGDAQKAIHHAFRAVQRADQLFAREQAVREYWRILDLLARVERTEQARTWRVDAVLGLLSWPAWARNEQERERGLAELDVAIETARERGDSALLARLEATRGQRLQDEAAFERALSHARNADDHSVEAVARGRYGDFLGSLGYYERAFEHIERAIDLHGDAGDERSQAMSMVSVGRCYCARAGRLEQSLAYAKRAREIGEQLDDPTLLAWGAMEAEPRMYLGQWDAVIRVFEAGMPHAIETGARWPLLFGSAWAAIAYVQQGRPDDAESVLQRAEEVGEAHAGTTFPMIYVRIARARLELARGNLEPARRAAESALALARGGHYRLDEGAALRVLARVRAAAGDDDAARDAFEASLDLLRELESRPELGQTLLRYGEFLKEHHADRGSELIEEAVGIFEATGATGWLQRARAASD